jgi:hypothetical protein
VQYVQEQIKPGEILYVSGADMSLRYLNGYENEHIGSQVDPAENNIHFGGLPDVAKQGADFQEFTSKNSYILISHANQAKISSLIEPLIPFGYLEKVLDVAETPLFYHANQLADLKTRVQYELLSVQTAGNEIQGALRITNTGEAYLNASGLPELVLASRQLASFRIPVEVRDLKPGDSATIRFTLERPADRPELEIQLMYEGWYWFDQLGIKPVAIPLPPS